MKGLIEIRADLYDISGRLREIDSRYGLYYNTIRKRYEIYVGRALQIAVPFPCLDARTVEHVRKTRIENRKMIIEEIERHNRLLEQRAQRAAVERAAAGL